MGEEEKSSSNASGIGGVGGKRFKHKTQRTPKLPDKLRGDYDKQVQKVKGAKERAEAGGSTTKKGELRSVDTMVKERRLKEKRQEKNARPKRKRA